MKRDIGDPIELLTIWWRHEKSRDLDGLGYPAISPSCAGYKPSRQYDDMNGAQDTDAVAKLALLIGHAVDRVEQPWRTALYITAKNHATGASVWRSPRLPEQQDQRAAVVAEAIERFVRQLEV